MEYLVSIAGQIAESGEEIIKRTVYTIWQYVFSENLIFLNF